MLGGRLGNDPHENSLGLLPSGPDPVGEEHVHRQPSDPIYRAECWPWQGLIIIVPARVGGV